MNVILAISLGGIAGSLSRYYLSLLVQKHSASLFPYGTLAVNMAGCLFIGFTMQFFIMRPAVSGTLKLFLVTGFAGAFTTFSTFGHETITLFMADNFKAAFLNIFASNFLGILAVFAGSAAARMLMSI
jgi:CrcB protein